MQDSRFRWPEISVAIGGFPANFRASAQTASSGGEGHAIIAGAVSIDLIKTDKGIHPSDDIVSRRRCTVMGIVTDPDTTTLGRVGKILGMRMRMRMKWCQGPRSLPWK